MNLLVVHGTGFPSETPSSAGRLPLDITQSAEVFTKQMSENALSCVGVGADWRKERVYLQQLFQSSISNFVVLIPKSDIDLAHQLGYWRVSNIVGYDPIEAIDWELVANTLIERHISSQSTQTESPVRLSSAGRGSGRNRKTIVFSDPVSKTMLALVQRVAQVEVTALLSGPSGVGKEVVAQILHNASPRANGPFIALNCSAMPEHLVESILFGHVKGSFTGAVKDQSGIFEEANSGTLFLDEVGELPLHIQPKLLRVIQECRSARIGSTKEEAFDVRLVAATNRDLAELVRKGEFREDLLYRLNAFHIGIPALTDRPGDIRQLAISFAQSESVAGISMEIEETAIQRLSEHSWPGNVRELDNVISRAKVLATEGVISSEHIFFDAMQFSSSSVGVRAISIANGQKEPAVPSQIPSSEQDLMTAKEQAEWLTIQTALQETDSKKEAAARLGISPRTLRHKLQKLKSSVDAEGELSYQSVGTS